MRQAFQRLLRILLVLKLDIHISYHVVVQIIAHMELFNRTIGLRKLLVHFFIELVKLLLLVRRNLKLGTMSCCAWVGSPVTPEALGLWYM